MSITFPVADSAPFPMLRAAYMRAIARAWRDPAYQARLLAARKTHPQRGVLGMLEEEYKFRFPFRVRLLVDVKHRPEFRPTDVCGWLGYADEFRIFLPARPARREDEAAVLARYYEEFPSLLGRGDLGVSAPDTFNTFGMVTGSLIAFIWRDKAFAKEILDPNLPDARGLVEDAMDCIVPWNFSLRFETAPGKSSDEDEYWETFPRSTITLNLPAKPDVDVQAVALAAYNATGGQYPFTCA